MGEKIWIKYRNCYHLQGTSLSLEEGCSDCNINFENLTIKELAEIDNWIFKCDCCGWWYDNGEMSLSAEHDNICEYCAADNDYMD